MAIEMQMHQPLLGQLSSSIIICLWRQPSLRCRTQCTCHGGAFNLIFSALMTSIHEAFPIVPTLHLINQTYHVIRRKEGEHKTDPLTLLPNPLKNTFSKDFE